MPELTNPTRMTDVAEDDWITAVTPLPSSRPRIGEPDSLYRIGSSLSPDTCFRASPIRDIPNRNMEIPESRLITSEILIGLYLHQEL